MKWFNAATRPSPCKSQSADPRQAARCLTRMPAEGRARRLLDGTRASLRCISPGTLVPLNSQPAQRFNELLEEIERLVPIQRRCSRGQHGDRPAPVLDELRDRQVGHGRSLSEHVFAV